ncbi:dual oxidase 2-like [Littorina saxatilis]|uniref:dual oxidase 2-like n=1 Tax=Littorina saxatilis TaxID=31220 RepID=UPI0038B5DC12
MTLQKTQQGQGIPDIFRKIIVQQFLKIRQGDRFWLENEKNGLFSAAELVQIKNTTFSDVLQQTTGLSGDDLTFTFTCADRGRLPGWEWQTHGYTLDLPLRRFRASPSLSSDADTAADVCTPLQTYDYFSGSEVSFALSFLALFLVVPASIGVLVLLARRRQRHRHSKSAVKSRSYKQRNPNKHKAREWQGSQSGERNVTVEFDGKRKKVLVRDGRGKELRFIDLRNQGNVRLKTTGQSGTLMSLGVEGEVDLILRFEDGACCRTS